MTISGLRTWSHPRAARDRDMQRQRSGATLQAPLNGLTSSMPLGLKELGRHQNLCADSGDICEFAVEKCDWSASKSPAAKIGRVVVCLGPAWQNGIYVHQIWIKWDFSSWNHREPEFLVVFWFTSCNPMGPLMGQLSPVASLRRPLHLRWVRAREFDGDGYFGPWIRGCTWGARSKLYHILAIGHILASEQAQQQPPITSKIRAACGGHRLSHVWQTRAVDWVKLT